MNSFEDINLPLEVQSSLNRLKFLEPTQTQKKVIPSVMEDRDVMACAETGSGKTAAFGIPMVSKLIENPNMNALVLAPTRELAQQISEFLMQLVRNCEGMRVVLLVGGKDIRKQFNSLRRKPRIIVATPGRLTDHLLRKTVSLRKSHILVLDEGDRMLDMGFAPQLDVILKYVPENRQTSLFTATLNNKVKELASKYLRNPLSIEVGRTSMPVSAIKQSMIQVSNKEKDDKMVDELNKREGSVIVFTKTQRRTNALANYLESYGFSVNQIHGGRSQGQRNSAIRNFKSGNSRILCATDVAARGLDVPSVEHVINYDLPMFTEDYVHRVGRTARNGADGEAVSFVTPSDAKMWNVIVRKFEIRNVELAPIQEGESRRGRKSKGRPRKASSFGGRSGGRSSKKAAGKKKSGKKATSKKRNEVGGKRPKRKASPSKGSAAKAKSRSRSKKRR